MARLTKAQVRFSEEFGGKMFSCPPKVSERNYEMFRDHVIDGVGYEELSMRYPDESTGFPISRSRTHQIVEMVLNWAAKEQAKANDGKARANGQNV